MKTQSKFSFLSLLIFFALISMNNSCFQSKEPEPAIEYPESGIYGKNILNENTNIELSNEHIVHPGIGYIYSLAANIPANKTLKVVFKNKSQRLPRLGVGSGTAQDIIESQKSHIWGFKIPGGDGWTTKSYDWTAHTQEFYILDQETADQLIWFKGEVGGGNAIIEFYENGATEPTRTKTIQW